MKEAKNVKYGSFMQPGHQLEIQVELVKIDGQLATFKGKGITEEGLQTVSAQIILHGSKLADKHSDQEALDKRLVNHWKTRFLWLSGTYRDGE
jgi:3-hydroxyacyl-[acyl-carrier-protein] dehydratase